MNRRHIFTIFVILIVMSIASVAQAQATRTWVSGVGDDVNPCSRTAPCKTFAGAISKTAAGGIISVLDPGGYGAITITKSITIDGTGTLGSGLNAGTNGVVINALSTSIVTLRNIVIEGGAVGSANNGFDGIRIIQAARVNLEDVAITGQSGDAMDIVPTAAGSTTTVTVHNCQIRNVGGKGIQINTSNTAVVRLVVSRTLISGAVNGVDIAGNNNTATITDSVIVHNSAVGVQVQATTSTASIHNSTIAYNGTGIVSGIGAQVPVIRLSHSMVTGNITNGVTGTGTIVGFTNNAVVGNGGDNTVSSSVLGQ
jgi:hypothetical protein